MFGYKSNISKIIKAIEKRKPKILQAMNRGIRQGVRLYESFIIEEYYSGRKRTYYGLNAPGGTLRGSWFIKREGSIQERVYKLANRMPYAAIHEYSGWTGRGHRSFIPKRTYVVDTWIERGWEDFIDRKVYQNLLRFAR